jgi:hypothetical protein
MKIKFFQKYNWFNLIGWLILLVGAVFLIWTIYTVNQEGENGHGIVLSDNDHHSTTELQVLFILENKPHIFWTSNWRATYGDCVQIKYLKSDIDWSDVGDKCDSNYFANKIVIYGFDYPHEKLQEIRVYNDSLLLKSLKFSDSFGVVLDKNHITRVEYLKDGKVIYNHNYSFDEVYNTNIINLDYSDIRE